MTNERRRALRYKVKVILDKVREGSIVLILGYGEGEGYVYDFEGDVSEKGIFVATDSPLNKGEEVEVLLSIPESVEVIRARGRVAWVGVGGPEGRKGMGIEIVEMEEKDRNEFNSFLKRAELKDGR